MKNFITFFDEKEGTTAIVSLLDQLEGISVAKSSEELNWEPFDRHSCGPLPLPRLFRLLNLLYCRNGPKRDKLTALYERSTGSSLNIDTASLSVGLKMRLQPHKRIANKFLERLYSAGFRRLMYLFLRLRGVTVFVAVRRDILRWALSKYHGDGTGQPGHIQFKLAGNELSKDSISPIRVDCDRLEAIIRHCEERHRHKRRIMIRMHKYGINVHPFYYEEFLTNPESFLNDFRLNLGIPKNDTDNEAALGQENVLQKVHSDDISEFVINHEEVKNKFCESWVSWVSPL